MQVSLALSLPLSLPVWQFDETVQAGRRAAVLPRRECELWMGLLFEGPHRVDPLVDIAGDEVTVAVATTAVVITTVARGCPDVPWHTNTLRTGYVRTCPYVQYSILRRRDGGYSRDCLQSRHQVGDLREHH